MNKILFPIPLLLAVFAFLFPRGSAFAAELQSTAQATVTVSSPLPRSATDVVKLSRAQVSDDIIVSYVQNSSSSFSLSSDNIVQLRKEGVSDRVLNAMLEQHRKVVNEAQAAVPASVAPVSNENNASVSAAETVQPTPAPAPPAATAPAAPASSVYVIPYPAATAAYYGYPYRPYYYPYYYGPSYSPYHAGPIVSFRFGFGGGYHHFHHRWR